MSISIPPKITPTAHPRTRPIVLPPQLDPSCVLCLLPMRGQRWHDYSGHGNHGTIYGASWTSKGRLGPALSFDGVDDYVRCPPYQFTNQCTVEAWVQTFGILDTVDLIARQPSASNDWGVPDLWVRQSTGNFEFHIGTTTQELISSSAVVQPNIWYHVVGVYDGTKMYLYVNGKSDATPVSQSGNMAGYWKWFYISRYSEATAYSWNGLIDEVLVFNRALAVDEIRALYELGAEVR